MTAPFPIASNPIAEGETATVVKWFNRFIKPASDQIYAMQNDHDAGWTALALGNSWTNFGGTWTGAAYRVWRGKVYMRGLITGGTTGTTICTLPIGARPLDQMSFQAGAGVNATARVDITNAGVVQCVGYAYGGTNAYLSFFEISFMANR